MRTIKFRGRFIYGKEWFQGDLEYKRADNIAVIHTYDKDGYYIRKYHVDPDTIGQFTSLYDCDGKEIFEGDILDFNGIKVEVRFVRGVFAFLANGDLDNELCGDCRTDMFAKVIGNIHDNPELLKGGKK